MSDTAIFIVGLVFITAILYVVFIRKDHFDEYAARRRGIQPEMLPGRKNWVLGNKAAGTVEKRLDYLPVKGGELCCPDCGEPTLLSGPSGGLSQNVVCDSCYSEFNIGLFDSPPLVMERFGKLGVGRAAIYGISPEEFASKSDSFTPEADVNQVLPERSHIPRWEKGQ